MVDGFSRKNTEGELVNMSQRAVASALVLSIRRVIMQLLLTVSNIILARILFPEVFGVFAILSFLVFIFSYLNDLGLGTALVQLQEEPSVRQLRGIFSIHLLLSLFSCLAIWLLAPFLISYYGKHLPQESAKMLQLMSLTLLFIVPGNVSGKMLERHLLYKQYAIVDVVQLLVSKVVAVVLALSGFGIGSLVFAEWVMRITGSMLYYLYYPWSIGFALPLKDLSRLFAFGLPYQVSSWVGLANAAVVPVYIGNFPGPGGWTGAQAVGFLTFAAGVAGIIRFFSEIIGQLVFPLISREQKNKQKIGRYIKKAIEIASFSSFGMLAVIFSLSREITYIIFTDRWLPAVAVLRLLLIQGAEISIGMILANTLLALGAARTYLKMNVIWAILQWLLTVPLVINLGFTGLGWASMLVSATGVFLPWYLVKRRVAGSYLSGVVPVLVAALISIFLIGLVKRQIVIGSIWNLLLVAGLGGLFYFVLTLLLYRKVLLDTWRLFNDMKKNF